LKENEVKEAYVTLLRTSQQFSHSFPKMEVRGLVDLSSTSWELLCEMNTIARAIASKKLDALKASPKETKNKKNKNANQKGDKDQVLEAESLLHRISALCTESNVELYRIRALKKVYSDHDISN
jgi:hypothetical protein